MLVRSLSFRKLVHAPLGFVFRWCADFRDDDDRLTDDIYQFTGRIVLREPSRVIRVITVPGRDVNRSTEVEVITLRPPDRWSLRSMSGTVDKVGHYRLYPHRPASTMVTMRFRESWKRGPPGDRRRYRRLFHRVWDRYAEKIEASYRSRG